MKRERTGWNKPHLRLISVLIQSSSSNTSFWLDRYSDPFPIVQHVLYNLGWTFTSGTYNTRTVKARASRRSMCVWYASWVEHRRHGAHSLNSTYCISVTPLSAWKDQLISPFTFFFWFSSSSSSSVQYTEYWIRKIPNLWTEVTLT